MVPPTAGGVKKFVLHQPTLISPTSTLQTFVNSNTPLTPDILSSLRQTLLSTQMACKTRLAIKAANKAAIQERMINEKKAAEEERERKEVERVRRREAEERAVKERIERLERERVEREAAGVMDIVEESGLVVEAPLVTPTIVLPPVPVPSPLVTMANGSGVVGVDSPAPVATNFDRVVETGSSPDLEDDGPKLHSRLKGMQKKRKREVLESASDSDEENLLSQMQKIDSATPTPGTRANSIRMETPMELINEISTTNGENVQKETRKMTKLESLVASERFVKHSIPTRPQPPGSSNSYYLPSSNLLPKYPVPVPPQPTAKKQSEVSEDFSNAKITNQVTYSVFHQWVDGYLRPFGEDDLAFLAPKAEDSSLYNVPPLGRFYHDVWDEEDGDSALSSEIRIPRTKPDSLNEDVMGMENIFIGPLSERLVAALILGDSTEEPPSIEELRKEGTEEIPNKLIDSVELEERVKRELRFVGLLTDHEIDWSTREDDEITSALRECQARLSRQSAINNSRKAILTSLVKDRMAYQEYEQARDAQERIIENGWMKRVRAGKKKGKKERERDRLADRKVPVSVSLVAAVEKRHRLVGTFAPFFEVQNEKGRFWGIPSESVYAGLPVEDYNE